MCLKIFKRKDSSPKIRCKGTKNILYTQALMQVFLQKEKFF